MQYTRRDLLKLLTGAAIGVGFSSHGLASQSSMKTLITRKIPGSGESLPVVGMGTWQTFDVGSTANARADVKEVLKEFVALGGKLIDSSPMYGNSEEVVGDLAADLNVQSSLFMATKVWTTGESAGIRQMENSMKLLRSKPIDLMQVHNLVDYATHYKTLMRWKAENKIRYIGITHYTTGSYANLASIIKRDSIDFVQFNYSIITREAESYLLPLAAEKKVGVIINRPFESGGLFSKLKGKALPTWASEFDCTSWGQFMLKYIIAHPAVTCVIPATSKVHHLKDNMNAGYGSLPDENTRKKMVKFFESI